MFVFHYGVAETGDGLSVTLDLSDQKLLKNDILFSKLHIKNEGETKTHLSRHVRISHGTLRFHVKRPGERSFERIHLYGAGTSENVPYNPQVTIEPATSHVVYSSLFVNREGNPVFSDPGTYKVRVSICTDFDRKEWIASSTRSVTVQNPSALDSSLIKNHPLLLKKLSLSATAELIPRPSEIKKVNKDQLEESNIKQFLSFVEMVSTQVKNKNINIQVLKERNEELRHKIGDIAADTIETYYGLSEPEDGNQ